MRRAAAWSWFLCAACSTAPVDPAHIAAEERRLLAPFVAGGEVGCGELYIEATGNFAQRNIGNPSIDVHLHRARKERGDGWLDTVWTNVAGTEGGRFVVTIGEGQSDEQKSFAPVRYTRFVVLRQVRLRVFEGTHPWTLTVAATGQPLLLQQAGAVRDLTEYRVEDGVLRAR